MKLFNRDKSALTARLTAYPTRRAVYAMAAGLPVSLLFALLAPTLWVMGAAWLAAVLGAMALDWVLSARGSAVTPELETPSAMDVGATIPVRLGLPQAPQRAHEASLSTTDEIVVRPFALELARSDSFSLTARRRGNAEISQLWQRWTGPLGMIWTQRTDLLDRPLPVITDTTRLTDEAINLFNRHADFGEKLQKLRGQGTEFDALSEFVQGMDPRAIDWKHSARHATLLAREYETEKNNHIVFAFDSGYLMNEETRDEDGLVLTKLDRSISAALLLSFLSLRLGDRVGMFAFDAKPYLYAPPTSGQTAFAQMQRQATKVDYSSTETNYTLGLTTLSQRLSRRTLVVIFSDFIDTTSAELMVENVARLMRRHVVVFVTFKNAGLQALTDREPESPRDLAEAIVADSLRQERELVLTRLERMGVSVLNTTPEQLNGALLNRYLALKARHVL